MVKNTYCQLNVLFVLNAIQIPYLPPAEKGRYIVVYGRPNNELLLIANSIELSNDLICKSKLFLSGQSQSEYPDFPALIVDQKDMTYKELKEHLQRVCNFTIIEKNNVPKWAMEKRLEGAR